MFAVISTGQAYVSWIKEKDAGKCHYGGVIIGEYASNFMCRGSLAVPEEIDCPQALT